MWRNEEVQLAVEMIEEGMTYVSIASALERTHSSVRNKLNKMGIRHTDYKESTKVETTCIQCLSKFEDYSRNNRKFCSSSCAAKANNSLSPKRVKVPILCSKCGARCSSRKALLCRPCWKTHRILSFCDKTLGEVIASTSSPRHRYQNVRNHAHRIVEGVYLLEKLCRVCSYDTYVELGHIKAIKDFLLSDTMGEINAKSNLAYLCPNHHKELDLGIISLHRESNPMF